MGIVVGKELMVYGRMINMGNCLEERHFYYIFPILSIITWTPDNSLEVLVEYFLTYSHRSILRKLTSMVCVK